MKIEIAVFGGLIQTVQVSVSFYYNTIKVFYFSTLMRIYMFEPIHYTTDIKSLYRWDSRPPSVVSKKGF